MIILWCLRLKEKYRTNGATTNYSANDVGPRLMFLNNISLLETVLYLLKYFFSIDVYNTTMYSGVIFFTNNYDLATFTENYKR